MLKRINKVTQTIVCVSFFILCAATELRAQTSSDSTDVESKMLAVLRSDADNSQKAIACKLLAVHGTTDAIPDLAKLLSNPKLASWSRIALEAIPGEKSDQALLNAANELKGNLLVGVVNSIGVRKIAGAKTKLEEFLANADEEVAAAAAVALGRIGPSDATQSLSKALKSESKKVRSAAAEGCILLAEELHAKGNVSRSIEIYDLVRSANVPKQRIIEATRGAILARKDEGAPLLIEQLRSKEKKFFQLGLTLIREFKGNDINQLLSSELGKAEPARAALIIQAISDRDDFSFVATFLQAMKKGDKAVRLSAIDALSRRGDSSCIDPLLVIGTNADAELAAAAKKALATLKGERIDRAILERLQISKAKSFKLLIELVGKRRLQATPILIKTLDSDESSLRHAAITSLGETVPQEELDVLIKLVVAQKHSGDREFARKALKAASVRMPDRDSCANELSDAIELAPASMKETLLEIVSEVGGKVALETVGRAANGKDPSLQDAGSRLLGKWNSLDAAPVLLSLANKSSEKKYQIRALRGYLGLARKFDMSNKQRALMCRRAFEASTRPQEKALALSVVQIRPSQDGLKFAIDALQHEEVKAEALQAALAISRKLGSKNADLQTLIDAADFKKVELEIVKAEYGAGSKIRNVTEIVKKHARDLPLIILPSKQYNTSFGGDPAPGVVKQLKIRYRMNGKIGSATFPENSPIVLTMPKR